MFSLICAWKWLFDTPSRLLWCQSNVVVGSYVDPGHWCVTRPDVHFLYNNIDMVYSLRTTKHHNWVKMDCPPYLQWGFPLIWHTFNLSIELGQISQLRLVQWLFSDSVCVQWCGIVYNKYLCILLWNGHLPLQIIYGMQVYSYRPNSCEVNILIPNCSISFRYHAQLAVFPGCNVMIIF